MGLDLEGIDLEIRLDSLFSSLTALRAIRHCLGSVIASRPAPCRSAVLCPLGTPLGLGSVPGTQKALSVHLLNTEMLDFTDGAAFCESGAENSASQSEPPGKCCPPRISDI